MENTERPILSVIQDIKDGAISARSLDKETRMQCVFALMSESYTTSQIAQVLDRSEKTIRRDIYQIREQFFKDLDVNFVRRAIGNLLIKAETHSSFLMRLARGREGSVGERVQAEYLSWKTAEELTKLLQAMGILPLKPKEVVGEMFHHFNDEDAEKTFVEVREELNRVVSISKEAGTLTPELEKNAQLLTQKITKAEIVHETDKFVKQINKEKEEGNV